jgi:hypothetical protein
MVVTLTKTKTDFTPVKRKAPQRKNLETAESMTRASRAQRGSPSRTTATGGQQSAKLAGRDRLVREHTHDANQVKIVSVDPFLVSEIVRMPQLLPLFMFHEVELGATTNEVASALGIEMEWVRERVEATRLCFAHQVRIGATRNLGVATVGDGAP